MANTELRLKMLVSEQLSVDECDIKPESIIADDLGADFLDEIELVMCVEEEFDIEISDEEVENIKTFGEALEFLKTRV